MKADASLVRPDSHAVLNPVAAIHLYLSLIVHPANTEHDDTLRFRQSFEQSLFGIVRMLLQKGRKAEEYLGNGLQVFGLGGIALLYVFQQAGHV